MPLTESQIIEAREAFNLFDRDSSGAIPAAEVVTVLRSLGYPVSAEVQKDADPEKTGVAKIGDFLRCVEKAAIAAAASTHAAEKQLPDLVKGINLLFGGQGSEGLVPVAALKRILMRTGERMSNEEVTDMFRELQIVDEHIKFKDLVNLLTQ